MTSVPVRAGLFTGADASGGEPAALVGGRCHACDRCHFPLSDICPYCSAPDTEAAELSRRGRLWAWTAVTAAPPGYRGEVPFGFGVVELPEGVRVVTRLTEPDPGRLREGQEMRLVTVPLHHDEEDREVLTYAFAPDGS